jgi:hypothetical protein
MGEKGFAPTGSKGLLPSLICLWTDPVGQGLLLVAFLDLFIGNCYIEIYGKNDNIFQS